MTNKHIILYYKKHYDESCSCSYCINKKGIIFSLQKLDYTISVEKLNCDWASFYPADKHFDYAIAYQNKIFGEFMFEADRMPSGIIEFAQSHFDYIICGSKFLYDTWLRSGINEKFLIPASLGIDTKIFNNDNCNNDIYPDIFKFLSVGAWQHSHWHDRKGFNKLINIFKKLFANSKNVMLIIKTNEDAPVDVGVKNIKIIREKMSDNDMANLYKCCARNGAFVSLHSGEGFGRTDLEALICGCKIGATGWSGVLDFLNKDNSFLLPYTFEKSKLYPQDYYLNNELPNIALVDEKVVKEWMLEIVNKKSSPTYDWDFTGKADSDYSWDSVMSNLMKKIKERL